MTDRRYVRSRVAGDGRNEKECDSECYFMRARMCVFAGEFFIG